MTRWDSGTEARLFAIIIKDLDGRGTKFEYAAIAEAFGQGVTPKAIQHRITALRKLNIKADEDGSGGTNPRTVASKRESQKVIKGGVQKPKRKAAP